MNAAPQHLRVFLSSPGDVDEERKGAEDVLSELSRAPLLQGHVTIEVVSWNDQAGPTPMSATETPQQTVSRFLPKPSDCNFTVVLLWGRLGTQLPPDMTQEDGQPYPSGTAWELDDARKAGKDVFIYHRTDPPPLLPSLSIEELLARKAQYDHVVAFVDKLRSSEGWLKGAVNPYTGAAAFKELFRKTMERVVQRLLKLPDPTGGFRIFLADAADDMAIARLRLSSALKQMDTKIVQDIPPPVQQSEHSAVVRDEAERADLCVHFLGKQPGAPVDWHDGWSYPAEQAQLALGVAKSQMVFHPPELALDQLPEGPYRSLLQQIQERKDARERLERIQTTANEMLKFVLEKRRVLEDARQHTAAPPNRALIDVSLVDLGSINTLSSHLDKKDVQPLAWPYATAARPQVRMASLIESLRTAKYFIVISGPTTSDLAEARAQEAWKTCIENGLQARVGMYVLPGGRTTARSGGQGVPYAVIDNSTGFDPKPIDAFLGVP